MKFAADPVTGAQIEAVEYLQRYGRRPLGAEVDFRPPPTCETCKQTLRLVAGKTDDTRGHFAHRPLSGYCPAKDFSALPYGKLTPTQPDPVRARVLRQQFVERWRWVFTEVARFVPLLDAHEFLELVRIADNDGLWGYRHLELRDVPELFLMLRDFTPATSRIGLGGNRRVYWFRFWYSANVRKIDDLWITPPNQVTLFRASFVAPIGRKKLPDTEALVKLKVMERVQFVPPLDPKLAYEYAERIISARLKRQ